MDLSELAANLEKSRQQAAEAARQQAITVNSGNTISEDRMPKGIKTVVVGIRVSPTVYARLEQRAERERRTVSAVCRLIVEDALDVPAPGPAGAATGQPGPLKRHPGRHRPLAGQLGPVT